MFAHIGGIAFGFLAVKLFQSADRRGHGIDLRGPSPRSARRAAAHSRRRSRTSRSWSTTSIEDPDLFGLYEGVPLTERSSWDAGTLPDRITIYRRPLQEEFRSEELEEEIRITVLHELAHFFGIDEDRLDELGYA